MRLLGWIYLGGYALDAGLSLVSLLEPSLLLASNVVSVSILCFTIVVFILACLGKLTPRKVFLVLSGYYFLLTGFGVVLGVLLLFQIGPQGLENMEITPQVLSQQFPWHEPIQWGLLAVWLCLAAWGFVLYSKSLPTEHPLNN
jgi:hypothetical protein